MDIMKLARGGAHSLPARTLLSVCLLVGTLIGGWTAGRFKHTRVSAASPRCLAGGVLMGCGSLLIPGGNDGLILVGLLLLWPYAWVAFATMCLVIACAIVVQRRFTARALVV